MSAISPNFDSRLAVLENESKHHTKQLEVLLAKKTDWKLVMMIVGVVMGMVVPAMGVALGWVHRDVEAIIEQHKIQEQTEGHEQELRIQKLESRLDQKEKRKGHGK